MPNCELTFIAEKVHGADFSGVADRARTTADGQTLFHPKALARPLPDKNFSIKVQGDCPGMEDVGGAFWRRGAGDHVTIEASSARRIPRPVSLDILFILDTTGSMGDEIQRLKDTLYSIHHQLTRLPVKPIVRFGMVLYRDRGDSYVVRQEPFTADVDAFQALLDRVKAGGGGDTPEDLQEGLRSAVEKMKWSKNGVRLAFVVTDAPPHLYSNQRERNYVWAMREAHRLGIKLYSVGASGLDRRGEFVLRQLAQYTGGQYLFLTYGEQGESEGSGRPKEGKVSHHTGDNWSNKNLDAMIVDIVTAELSYLLDEEIRVPETPETDEETQRLAGRLDNILEQIDSQLQRVGAKDGSWSVMPLEAEKGMKPYAEFLEDLLAERIVKGWKRKIVVRKDLDKVLQEQGLGLTGAVDPETAARVGKLVGAAYLLSGRLHLIGADRVLYLKAIGVEKGSILAMARIRL